MIDTLFQRGMWDFAWAELVKWIMVFKGELERNKREREREIREIIWKIGYTNFSQSIISCT